MFLAPVISSPLAGLKTPPTRLLIAKWGRNDGVNGSFTVGQKTRRILPAVQAALGLDSIKLDFEHNTVPGTEAFKAEKEPRNIAANARLAVVDGEGIYAEDIQWTPHGIKSITEGLHSDLSPTIKTDDAGEVVLMHSAALCRHGSVPDLRVFNTADLLSATQLKTFSATVNQPETTPTMDQYKKLLLMLLGLAETATDTDIETAAKAAAEKLKAPAEEKKPETEAAAEETDKTLETHSAKIAEQGKVINLLVKRLDDSERENILSKAIMAGKLVPHGIDKLDNEQLKSVIDGLEAGVVPLAQRTPDKLKTFSVSSLTTQPNSADETVRKGLGIPKEVWDKQTAAA